VTRHSAQLLLINQLRRWLPILVDEIEIELLQERRADQRPASAKNTRACGSANALAAAEGDQIGALGNKTAQIAGRRTTSAATSKSQL